MKTTIAFGILLAISRIWLGFTIEPEAFHWIQVYKDTAHLFMGGLAVAWWIKRLSWQWHLFWGLNVVEVVTAIGSRM